MGNSIVAGNTATQQGANTFGTISSQGFNLLSGDPQLGPLQDNGGNLLSGDPKLGALADNGGPTFTMALLAGSPAIDEGDDADAPITDQRGEARVGAVDIGAFEYQTPHNTSPTLSDIAVSVISAEAKNLSAAIFDGGFSDADSNTLTKIKIISLPTNGVLRLDGNGGR